jgi:nitrogen fixation protein FixH
VLFGMLAFFAVTTGVNAIMIYQAVRTFGGVETADAYRLGLAYNRRIAEGEQQAQSGWSDRIEVGGTPARVRVSMLGQGGEPLRGLEVKARIGRPASNRDDMNITLAEIEPGIYASPVAALSAGTWIADITATASGASSETGVYRARRRIWLKP